MTRKTSPQISSNKKIYDYIEIDNKNLKNSYNNIENHIITASYEESNAENTNDRQIENKLQILEDLKTNSTSSNNIELANLNTLVKSYINVNKTNNRGNMNAYMGKEINVGTLMSAIGNSSINKNYHITNFIIVLL